MKRPFGYPADANKLIKLLRNLGFISKGGGSHAYKFFHPERHASIGKRDFITLNLHNVDEDFSENVIEDEIIGAFNFTVAEVEFCLKKPIHKMPNLNSK